MKSVSTYCIIHQCDTMYCLGPEYRILTKEEVLLQAVVIWSGTEAHSQSLISRGVLKNLSRGGLHCFHSRGPQHPLGSENPLETRFI